MTWRSNAAMIAFIDEQIARIDAVKSACRRSAYEDYLERRIGYAQLKQRDPELTANTKRVAS